MIAEADKHRAVTIQIIGFALMSPLGNLVLNVFQGDVLRFGIIIFLAYVIVSFALFYCGMICLLRSIDILREMER